MTSVQYCLVCPVCKEIAEFEHYLYSEEKDVMFCNLCKCVPQITVADMVMEDEDLELYKSLGFETND